MTRLKAGAILLSVWSGANLVVAVAVTAMTLARGRAPALSFLFAESDLATLDARAIAIINAQAALANPCVAAYCALVLVIVWTSLVARRRWAFWALAATSCMVQAFGFVSDAFIGGRNLAANAGSTVLLLVALALAADALITPRQQR